ncbi:MAG: chromosome segregation protein SMC [Acidobacteriota bacterium]|nr:chromosome segregation protein SMC [Blastocatellia bacterium]MDW8167641.1 chromosome segregation protein SMC [Acidobacteriota bacterium]MDW8256241.1 chromosome segregation protein SMC [Acidobacteriota bacterium]
MWRLERIELHGFKSFCDLTELTFPNAITAIVGPNGCGKSNIADAIAWVLGEQSARSLRGTRMEDVIFQGTRARPPLGMAEVTLTLVATEEVRLREEEAGEEASEDKAPQASRRSWPVAIIPAGTVVTISRRLYRSGESEYLIDGQPVRLRDIYDLFAGTGLGPGHYALIGQDRVTALIQAKPSERRAVIEEAAGITRLKLRERTTELRLESARQNLVRLNDLIAEVERQVGTLKRQAARARRYRRLREELRALLRQLFRFEAQRLDADLAAADERIAALERARADVMAEIATLEAEQQRLVQEERAREARIASTRERLAQIEVELERVRGQAAQCETQLEDLRVRERALEREEEEVQQRLGIVVAEIARLTEEMEKVIREIATHEEEMRGEQAQYERALAFVAEHERELEQMRAHHVQAIATAAHWHNVGQQLLETSRRLEAQLRRLETERERAAAREAQLLTDRESLLRALESQRREGEMLRAAYEEAQHHLENVRQQEEQVRAARAEAEKAAIAVENRLASLLELDERFAYASRAVQYLFEFHRQNGHVRLLGTLADILRVAPEDERMVEGFLGERLQAILVPSLDDAQAALTILESAQAGRAHFLVLEEGEAADGRGEMEEIPELNGFFRALGATPALARALVRAFPECERVEIAQDLETAIRRSAEDPNRIFLTREGTWVRGGTLLVGGRGGEQPVGILAVKREIRDLHTRREELAERLDEVRREQQELEGAVQYWLQESAQRKTALEECERVLREHEQHLSEVERDLARARQHLAVIEFEHAEAERERERVRQEYAHALAERERAEERLRALEAEHRARQAALAEQRRQNEALAERMAALRVQLAAKGERRQAIHGQVRRLEQERHHLLRRLEELRLERASLRHEQEQCTERQRALTQRERELEEARERAEAEVRHAMEHLSGAHVAVDALAARLAQQREQESRLRDRLQQEEIARAQLVAERRHVSESCQIELGQSLDEVLSIGEESGPTGDAHAVRARIAEVRRKLEELGPINLMAVEELQQAEERLAFLRAQREDVERSIASTEEALREIRRRARHRFLAAFEAINEHFDEVFRELFGGGRAEMLLLDAENVLESGIDILAQPPGKRLQNLQLLSGGEKALTALALLLAIFRYRPSPFCVLDEVDAPLDDMNIARFARQIVQMSHRTQFILITHNKGTMEIADVLYGVTMEEPGVSKVVSVRLQ